jgi:signal transduction histidine kinase
VAPRGSLRDLALRPRLRGRSARFRLTALYCCLFFPSGVLLVFITYALIVLVDRPNAADVVVRRSDHKSNLGGGLASGGVSAGHSPGTATVHIEAVGHSIALTTGEFLVGSCIVLIAMIGASVLLGWLAAGRVLRPLRIMTATARQISERNLHERLALTGPDDELKDLGDTIDALLARLDSAFDSQQRFVANASHELRTPLMLSQTLLQVALADPRMSVDSLRTACQEAIDAGKDQAELIDALLALARSQSVLDHREPLDLAKLVGHALLTPRGERDLLDLEVTTRLEPAHTTADPRLIERLIANLIDNAVRHNVPHGNVEITTGTHHQQAFLTVTNSGPVISADDVQRLFQPFQRLNGTRTQHDNGHGLGLSIVQAIAIAHDAGLRADTRPEGGLTIAVSFPTAAVGHH